MVKSNLKASNLLAKHKNGGHTLRHSFASLIYKESNNLLLLQQLLGHSSIEITRIYTHLDENAITNATKYLDVICE
ncbi:MAG: tyrosine-type recombinase/integrase [Helicobacteraceae bacterium]|nr:tyrosine-type recombinase/integrase [Helicobacteraceae bacterium]